MHYKWLCFEFFPCLGEGMYFASIFPEEFHGQRSHVIVHGVVKSWTWRKRLRMHASLMHAEPFSLSWAILLWQGPGEINHIFHRIKFYSSQFSHRILITFLLSTFSCFLKTGAMFCLSLNTQHLVQWLIRSISSINICWNKLHLKLHNRKHWKGRWK